MKHGFGIGLSLFLVAAGSGVACDADDGQNYGDGGETEGDGGGSGIQPDCHPLDQNCPGGQTCYASGDSKGFTCADNEGTDAAFGEPCMSSFNCAPGLMCGLTEVVPNCADGFGCCTQICEPDDGCPVGLECLILYPQGAPPGFEELGQCVPVGS